jgi:PAS domain S-box-containing protein
LDFAGADKSDAIGQYFWDTPWWDPPQQSTVRDAIQRAAQGEFVRFECTHVRYDGEVRDFDFSLSPIRDDDGSVIYLVPEGRDITEQKRAEASLRQKEAELAHVARVSTIGEMVAGLAHELNQPLYTIQNYGKACGNLLGDDNDVDRDQIREWLDEITSTAEYAGEVLLRLRNFVNRVPSEKEVVDLGETIGTAISFVHHEARESVAAIECAMSGALPTVFADAVQIQQVIVNLLRNAIEATQEKPHGDPQVTISTETKHDLVEVAVADNGAGLPSESDLKIFEAFNSTKPDGMGLGLAISKTIVEAHGGTLVADNRPGGGAVFRFTLPIRKRG